MKIAKNNTPPRVSVENKIGEGGNQRGFTIIEVALVLAIAGLIFLVVFVAWPALQNSQADTARRQDVGIVIRAIDSYRLDASNGGWFPVWQGVYLNSSRQSLSFGPYLQGLSSNTQFVYIRGVSAGSNWTYKDSLSSGNVTSNATTSDSVPSMNGISVYTGTECGNGQSMIALGDPAVNPTHVAVVIRLSSGIYYCQQAY